MKARNVFWSIITGVMFAALIGCTVMRVGVREPVIGDADGKLYLKYEGYTDRNGSHLERHLSLYNTTPYDLKAIMKCKLRNGKKKVVTKKKFTILSDSHTTTLLTIEVFVNEGRYESWGKAARHPARIIWLQRRDPEGHCLECFIKRVWLLE